MCVVSMVMDHYRDRLFPGNVTIPIFVPQIVPLPNPPTHTYILPEPSGLTKEDVQQIVKEFWEALEAAKKVDKLTGQPDCEDPEKIKLVKRVKALEKELAALKKPKKARAQSSSVRV